MVVRLRLICRDRRCGHAKHGANKLFQHIAPLPRGMQVLGTLAKSSSHTSASVEAHADQRKPGCGQARLTQIGIYLLIKCGMYFVVETSPRAALQHGLGEISKAVCMLYNPIMIGKIVSNAPVDCPAQIVHIGIANHSNGQANGRLCMETIN